MISVRESCNRHSSQSLHTLFWFLAATILGLTIPEGHYSISEYTKAGNSALIICFSNIIQIKLTLPPSFLGLSNV